MLSIIFHPESGLNEMSWHVGKSLEIPFENIAQISSIQADGHELEAIIHQYTHGNIEKGFQYTIPFPRNLRVIRWYDGFARTIVANLT